MSGFLLWAKRPQRVLFLGRQLARLLGRGRLSPRDPFISTACATLRDAETSVARHPFAKRAGPRSTHIRRPVAARGAGRAQRSLKRALRPRGPEILAQGSQHILPRKGAMRWLPLVNEGGDVIDGGGDAPAANRGGKDIAFAVGIVLILCLFFLPVPAVMIDFGLALSIALSVLILMVALWIQKPLEFSAFPTVLLVATILRLALNISTTRLILSHGEQGPTSAGYIIGGFALGDDQEVDGHQDEKDDDADDEIAAHHQVGEAADDVARRRRSLLTVRQDKPSGRNVEREPQDRRHQKHGREGRELERLLDPQRHHQDEHGKRDRQRKAKVDHHGRNGEEKQAKNKDDANGEGDVLAAAVCCRGAVPTAVNDIAALNLRGSQPHGPLAREDVLRTLREDRTAGVSAALQGSFELRPAHSGRAADVECCVDLGPARLSANTDAEGDRSFSVRSVAHAVEMNGSRGESRPCGSRAS